MTCDTCRDYLPEYLEHALPKNLSGEMEEHLAACAGCRRARAMDTALLDAARVLPRHHPATTTILHISEEIHACAPPPRRTEFGPVLDMADLSEYLRVQPDVLGMYVNEIPHFELGGRLLFRLTAVERWIAKREQAATLSASNLEILEQGSDRYGVTRGAYPGRTGGQNIFRDFGRS